jgi:hypothetical protein
MFSATCSIRFFSFVAVKFRSRELTALNLLPSTAASACVKSPELSAQHHELATNGLDCSAVIPSEVGGGLMVRRQSSGEPHQLDVALCLALQAAT